MIGLIEKMSMAFAEGSDRYKNVEAGFTAMLGIISDPSIIVEAGLKTPVEESTLKLES